MDTCPSTANELLYVYAVATTQDTNRNHSISGLLDVGLFWLSYEGLSLAVSRKTGIETNSMESLLQHEAVVQSLHDYVDIIPMRFGTIFASSQIQTLISERENEFKRLLSSIGNCSELLLRWSISDEMLIDEDELTSASATSTKPSAGGDYLRKKYSKSQNERRYDLYAREVQQSVESILDDSIKGVKSKIIQLNPSMTSSLGKSSNPIIAIDVLVSKKCFQQVFQKAKEIEFFGKPPISARGPLPTYSFSVDS